MIEIKHLSLQCLNMGYPWQNPSPQKKLLSNLNLTLHQGELVALVGSSGEGKTLLFESLLGLLPKAIHCEGKIFIENNEIGYRQRKQLRGKTISYIPQSVSALNPLITIGKQIERAAALSGVDTRHKSRFHAQVIKVLAEYNLPESLLKQYPLSLSGGMAKRIMVAMATLSQSPYILADEITAWLDDQHTNILMNHLQGLCQQGRGVLWITHDLYLASQFADRIALLHQGEIKEITSSEQLLSGAISPWLSRLWRALPENQFLTYARTTEEIEEKRGA